MEMQIFVKNNKGRCNSMTVRPTDSINFLNVDDLHLIVKGKVVKSGSTFAECGIKDQDTIVLCERGSFRVCVDVSVDFQLAVDVESTDKIGTLKAKVQEDLGIPVEKQRMYYNRRLLDNDEAPLGFYGITKRFLGGPIVLDPDELEGVIENQTSYDEYIPEGMEPKAVFTYTPCLGVMQIFVEFAANNIYTPLEVKPTDTIDAVKAMIPCFNEERKMLLFGKRLLVDGNSTLEECGIKNRDCVTLCDKELFSIHIYSPTRYSFLNDSFIVEVCCLETIGSVKAKIQEQTGIPPAKQRLRYHRRWLVDDGSSLVEYGIMKSARFDYNLLLLPPEAGQLQLSNDSHSLLPSRPPKKVLNFQQAN